MPLPMTVDDWQDAYLQVADERDRYREALEQIANEPIPEAMKGMTAPRLQGIARDALNEKEET